MYEKEADYAGKVGKTTPTNIEVQCDELEKLLIAIEAKADHLLAGSTPTPTAPVIEQRARPISRIELRLEQIISHTQSILNRIPN